LITLVLKTINKEKITQKNAKKLTTANTNISPQKGLVGFDKSQPGNGTAVCCACLLHFCLHVSAA